MTTLDEAAAKRIKELEATIEKQVESTVAMAAEFTSLVRSLVAALEESERQRKILADRIAEIGIEGINAATGAGRDYGKH